MSTEGVKSKDKKLILVRGDLAEKITEMSKKEGKTIYSLTNEVLEDAIRAYMLGYKPSEMIDYFLFTVAEKEAGAVVISADILMHLISKIYSREKEALWKKWVEWGQWYGKYLAAKFYDQEPLETLKRMFGSGIWEVSDFNFLREANGVSMRCLMPHLSSERTELFSKFLEGMMDSFGYCLTEHGSLRGIISLKFEKKPSA